MKDEYVKRISEDGAHMVHVGDIGPGDSNRRECYLCGSHQHWTMQCPRKGGSYPNGKGEST